MVAHVTAVAFLTLEARSLDIEVRIAMGGMNAFNSARSRCSARQWAQLKLHQKRSVQREGLHRDRR